MSLCDHPVAVSFAPSPGGHHQRITVPWKKVLTQLQMVQFVVCATHSFYVMYTGCYPTKMALLELWVMFNMLFLFWNFYSNKYNRGKGKRRVLSCTP